MTFAEFARATKLLAGDRYCSVQVEANLHTDRTALRWSTYVEGDVGFPGESDTPEGALELLRRTIDGSINHDPESVGDPSEEI